MILAELADKMNPVSYFIGMTLLFGMSLLGVLLLLRGPKRFVWMSVVLALMGGCAIAFQVDTDLVEGVRGS